MQSINLGRVIVGGVVAGTIFFVGDGIVHGALLQSRWVAVMAALGRSGGGNVGSQYPLYFLAYDLVKGLLAVGIYAAIRPRFGAGPSTAIIAALLVWVLVIPTPLLGLLPMEFFGRRFAVLWSLYGLVPIVVGSLVGGWLYRENAAA
jgi:hypothetical protein